MFYLTQLENLLSYQFSYLDHVEDGQLERTKPNHLSDAQWKKESLHQRNNQKKFRAIDVMSATPITVDKNELIPVVEKLFSKNQFRHIPVMNRGNIIGMISNQDLNIYKGDGGYNYLRCSQIMSSLIICAHENTPIFKISQVLIREKINSIPIVNSERKLVGIVTTSDILRLTVENSFLK
jgi:CBS domain-containing protein